MLIHNRNSHIVLVVTFLAILLPPLGNDIYFASLPTIGHEFATGHISLMVTVYLAGFALTQLFYGPLSDRFGRRPLLLVAISLVLVGCFTVWMTHHFSILLIARFVQSVGACGTLCIVLAIIRDSYKPEFIVKVTGVLFAILGFVPAFAPLLGGYIASISSWRNDFLLLIVITATILLLVGFFFSESMMEKKHDALKFKSIVSGYRQLLGSKLVMSFSMGSCFSYASLFSFICASPFLLIKPFGLNMVEYGWIIALNGMGIIFAGFLVPKLSNRYSVAAIALFGSILLVTGALLMLILNLFFITHSLVAIMVPAFIVITGVGFIRPTASAGALTNAPVGLTGSSSALFSFIAFIGGAVFSMFGQYAGQSVVHLSLFLLVTGVLALASILKAYRAA